MFPLTGSGRFSNSQMIPSETICIYTRIQGHLIRLWLCYPDEDMISEINPESVRFAEMLATAWDGIQP